MASLSRPRAASPILPNRGLDVIDEATSPKALPGTMSAKTVQRQSSGHRSRSHDGEVGSTASRQSQPALAERVRTALRDLFKKDPVDESNLEHIDHHHWAEDD